MEQATVEPSQANVETPIEQGQSQLNDCPVNVQPSQEPTRNDKHWLFNAEMAREANRKSIEARRKREVEAEQAKAIVSQLQASAIVAPSEIYRLERLALIRSQLAQVDSELSEAIKSPKADQRRSKWLKEMQSSLSEQERKLDMRPDPGVRRPSKPTTPRPSSIEPSE